MKIKITPFLHLCLSFVFLLFLMQLILIPKTNSDADESAENTKEINLPIHQVVLYGSMAEISRKVTVPLHKGINYLEINDLPEKMKEATLQVDIGQKAELRKLEVLNVHKKIYLSEEAKNAEKNLKDAEIRLNRLTNRYKALQKEMVFLENLEFLTHNSEKPGENRLRLSLWKSSLNFFHTAYSTNQKNINDILPVIDEAREEFFIAMTVADRYKSGIQKKSKTCIVEILSPTDVKIPMNLTYRIGDAGWFPSYTARIVPESGTKASGEITWYAFVKNETGEDWPDAGLIFSTSDPEESVRFPKLSSRMIKYRDRNRDKAKFASAKTSAESFKRDDFTGAADDADEIAEEASPIQAKRIIRKNMPQSAMEQQIQINNRMESSKKAYNRNMSTVKDDRARSRSAESEKEVRNIQNAAKNMDYYYRNERYDYAIKQSERVLESYGNLPERYQKHFEDDRQKAVQTRENALKMKQNAEITNKFVLPHTSSRGFDYRFQAKIKETVPSQKVFYTVFLKNEKFFIRLFHETVPYRSLYAYLTGTARNHRDIPILSGPMRVFYDNNFNGVMKIDTISPGAEFKFHFGVDQNVKIIRKDSHYRSESGVFSGSYTNKNKVNIHIRNNKNRSIQMIIYERVPFVQNDKVTVTSFKSSQKVKKRHKNGILEYHIPIKGKMKNDLWFSYEIDHDKDIMIIKNEYRDGSL